MPGERNEIVATITQHLREVIPGLGSEQLPEGQDLREFPAFDSLGVLETLVWLENTFAVVIPDQDLVVDRFDSVAKMADYVLANRR